MTDSRHKTSVLIVDDEKAIRDILHQTLKVFFDVVPAENGSQGLNELQARKFELALLDVQMPGMDGIQLLEEIGRKSPDTAVVMISGVTQVDTALDLRDSETEHHCLRVASFVMKLARKSGISEKDRLKDIEWGAFLHDIGKIGVPDAILMKPGRLTEREREIIRTHPVLGYQMLRKIPFLKGAAEVVFSHHESYDGSGYPQGLAGEDIPLSARLFAVADTIDAMTSDRPYRDAMPLEAAGRELQLHLSI